MDQHELMIRVLCTAGGIPMEEALPPDYAGKLADVLFARENVVVEVKTIASDRADDPRTGEAIALMFSENVANGAPVIFGQVTIGLHDLPVNIAEKALRIVGKRVKREVTEANRQIRASKEALGRDDACGLLVIVTPPYKLDRESVGWLVGDALRGGSCRSINAIMIVETPLCAPAGLARGGDSHLSPHSRDRVLSRSLLERINAAWGTVTGQPRGIAPWEVALDPERAD